MRRRVIWPAPAPASRNLSSCSGEDEDDEEEEEDGIGARDTVRSTRCAQAESVTSSIEVVHWEAWLFQDEAGWEYVDAMLVFITDGVYK